MIITGTETNITSCKLCAKGILLIEIVNTYDKKQISFYNRNIVNNKNRHLKKLGSIKTKHNTGLNSIQVNHFAQHLTGKIIPEVVKQTLALGPQFVVKQNRIEIDYSTLFANVQDCIKRKVNVDDDNRQLLRLNVANLLTNYQTENRNSNKFDYMKKNYSLTKEYLKDNLE